MSLWIVEGKIVRDTNASWRPILAFPGVDSIHFTREEARDAARAMQEINANNRFKIIVKYRATKYVPQFESQNNYLSYHFLFTKPRSIPGPWFPMD